MQVLAQRLALYAGCRDVSAYPVNRKQQEGKNDPLPELGDIEDILQACEQGLDYLDLPAGGLDFFHGALAELVRADGKRVRQFPDT